MGLVHLSVDINLHGDAGPDEEWSLDRAEQTLQGMPDVLTAIAGERCRQDIQWGGFSHDDSHNAEDWERLIVRHAYQLTVAHPGLHSARPPSPHYRQRLIKIAALAVAAAQAWDRKAARRLLQDTPKEG